jgi:PKD repeat protein
MIAIVFLGESIGAVTNDNDDWIHYDNGEFYSGLGMIGNVPYEGGIRFTLDELKGYDGWELTTVKFYHYVYQGSESHSGEIKIYGAGTTTEPGSLLTSEPYFVTGTGWKEIQLSNPVIIDANEDLWVSVYVSSYGDNEYPLGYDKPPSSGGTGAVIGKGDWVFEEGWPWYELRDYGIDSNWLVRAGVKEKEKYPPVASFTYSPTDSTTFDIIEFSDTSYDDGTIVSWLWDLGDGSYLDVQNPTYSYSEDDTYIVTLTVTDNDGLIATSSETITVYTPEEKATAYSYVVLAKETIKIRKNSIIVSGDVGANSKSTDGKETMRIGKNVNIINNSSKVKADFIKLKKNAEVWDVYYNKLDKHKTAKILGSEYTPLTLPVADFPSFPVFSCGDINITVKKNEVYFLEEGDYGHIKVRRGGKLIFTGGVYNIATLTARKNVELIFQNASEVRIESRLTIGKNSIVGPKTDSTLSASGIVFYVGGEDTNNLKAVTIRRNGKIDANIYAPNGTIVLRKNTEATGSFIGKNVVIGKNVQLTWDSAFQ